MDGPDLVMVAIVLAVVCVPMAGVSIYLAMTHRTPDHRLPRYRQSRLPRGGTEAIPLPHNSGARAVRAGSSAKAAIRVPPLYTSPTMPEPPGIREIGSQPRLRRHRGWWIPPSA